jgi:hypothetical protein
VTVLKALTMLLEGEGALPPAARKVLSTATLNGWTVSPVASLVIRLNKEDDDALAKPVFVGWRLNGLTPGGKPSWTFDGCRVKDGTRLTVDDALEYLEDPGILDPDPAELEDWAKATFGEGSELVCICAETSSRNCPVHMNPPRSDDDLIAPAKARYKDGWNLPVNRDLTEPQPEKRMAF